MDPAVVSCLMYQCDGEPGNGKDCPSHTARCPRYVIAQQRSIERYRSCVDPYVYLTCIALGLGGR